MVGKELITATVRILYWRDIPSKVEVEDESFRILLNVFRNKLSAGGVPLSSSHRRLPQSSGFAHPEHPGCG